MGLTNPKSRPSTCVNDLCVSAASAAVARGTEGHPMTALWDITVVLDDAAPSETRLTTAIALAQQHNAYLTGLSALALLLPARPVIHPRSYPETETSPASSLRNLGDVAAEKAERIETVFRERLRLSSLQGDWRVVSGKIGEAVAREARHTDLIILGQVDPAHPLLLAGQQLIQEVLLTAGRPLLVIPYIGQFKTVGSRVLVAWNGSREAARAVHDALSLLTQAASVTILARISHRSHVHRGSESA